MHVLIFHGYLLRGTGSNVYNAELARALAAQGHHVHLFCQDRRAADLPWVDVAARWEGPDLIETPTGKAVGPGKVTTYVPDIGGLLPVYVHDSYEGFEVKTFPELSEAELDRYLSANVAAVSEVVDRTGGVGAALANHLVMGPVILARAGLRFAAKIHGSDLSYTVRPHPDRFVPYAREGVEAAAGVLVGSAHTAHDLWQTVALDGLEEKTRLGPPGLDPAEFAPREREAATAGLKDLAASLRQLPGEQREGGFGRDSGEAATALEWYAEAPGPRVLYVGKFLFNKGVDLLITAWPLILRDHPRARLLLAGFGAFRPELESLWAAISSGEIEVAARVSREATEDGEPKRMRMVADFLEHRPPGYEELGRAAAGSIGISGRLEHSEVAEVMPAAEALVMPSTFPEAFGMVTAEAAAAGALPVSAGHSGMAEVAARLSEAASDEVAWMLSFALDQDPVAGIAARVSAWLSLDPTARASEMASLSAQAGELWSWDGVARGIIAASNGDLMRLARPQDII